MLGLIEVDLFDFIPVILGPQDTYSYETESESESDSYETVSESESETDDEEEMVIVMLDFVHLMSESDND